MLSNPDGCVDASEPCEAAKPDDEYDSGATTGGSDKGNLSESDVEKGVQDLRLSSQQEHKVQVGSQGVSRGEYFVT